MQALVFSGADAVKSFQCASLASGLRLYAKSGMKPNRAWTPTAMLRTAESLTGLKFKRGEYEKAAQALSYAGLCYTAASRVKAERPDISDEELNALVKQIVEA